MKPTKKKQETISHDEHSIFVGMTGSGKTFCADFYSRGVNKPLFTLDTKGKIDPPNNDWLLIRRLSEIQTAAASSDRVIYRPDHREMSMEWFDSFFGFCYALGDCSVMVDEVMQVCPNANKIPDFYKGILTRGRELNVNVFSCTQRPATIPVVILSESTHWFVFRLNNPDDRKKMTLVSGYDIFEKEKMTGHDFLYLDQTRDAAPGKFRISGGRVVAV